MEARGGHWGAVLEGEFGAIEELKMPFSLPPHLPASPLLLRIPTTDQGVRIRMVVPGCDPGICSWVHLSHCPILTSLLLPFFLLVCLPPSFLPCCLPCFFFLHSLSLYGPSTLSFSKKKRFLAPTVCEAHC